MSHLRRALGTVPLIVLFIASGSIGAQSPRTVQDGVFTDAQAARGQAVYAQRCAGCHGPALAGAQGPPLSGDSFTTKFRMEPLSALFIKIRYTMPPSPDPPDPAPVALQVTPGQAADLVAHILRSNSFPAGTTEFAAADATTSEIGWPAARAAAAPAAQPPTGTLAQLMRGVFFPNSNLIFTVQERDPKAPAPPRPAGSPSLTIFEEGQSIYTGWPVVENAAAAIADASPLMLSPGLRCENGRLAPVTDPDWIKFTDRTIAIAKRTYRLSQMRNQEAVSEATTELANACLACHSVYRDIRRGRGANAQGAGGNSLRCTHR